jgi:hypothetical protein
MLNLTACNAALAALIAFAALAPAILDVARAARCAMVPCRGRQHR